MLNLASVGMRVTDLEFGMEKLQARINRLERLEESTLLSDREIFAGLEAYNVRANAHAEDIQNLHRRIEKLENYAFEHIGELDEAALQLARYIKELAERIEKLEKRASSALHERVRTEAQRDKLAERMALAEEGISFLEIIMELHSQRLPDLSLADTQAKCHTAEHKALAERIEKLEKGPAKLWADLEENIELGHRLAKLKEQVEQLERLLEKGHKKERQNGSGNS